MRDEIKAQMTTEELREYKELLELRKRQEEEQHRKLKELANMGAIDNNATVTKFQGEVEIAKEKICNLVKSVDRTYHPNAGKFTGNQSVEETYRKLKSGYYKKQD